MPRLADGVQRAQPAQPQDDDLFSKFDEAWRTLGPGVQSLLQQAKRATGANADLGCSCAKCLRKAGPVREDSEERILHITHVLADVYEETPNPEEHIKPHHKSRARQFMAAVEANDVERLETYFQECQEEHRGEIVGELIISAAQAGHVDTIKCLAKYATDKEYLDMADSAKGARPLMFAAHNGHVAAVRLLLELGADPNATDDHGYNALTISTFCDRAGVAEALCQHKETIIDQVDERERTALCYAALYGSDNCVHVLAAHGADVFHQDDEQTDPLDLAEQSGRASTADALRKLQLKARMAMRRAERKADAAEKAACTQMDEAERARRAADAEAKAAELLAECQREEAAKKAQVERVKKLKQQQKAEARARKNARLKGGDAMTRSASTSGSEAGPGKEAAAESGTGGGDANGSQPPHSAVGSDAAHHPAAQGGSAPPGKQKDGSKAEHQLPAQHAATANGHAAGAKSNGNQHPVAAPLPASLTLPPASAPEPVLRRAWGQLLEDAKECKDAAHQLLFLEAVKRLLPRAAEASISVKYGRKVLQRLEAVGPARSALVAALAAKPRKAVDLGAAVKLARPAASLLDAALMAEAEAALEACTAAEARAAVQSAPVPQPPPPQHQQQHWPVKPGAPGAHATQHQGHVVQHPQHHQHHPSHGYPQPPPPPPPPDRHVARVPAQPPPPPPHPPAHKPPPGMPGVQHAGHQPVQHIPAPPPPAPAQMARPAAPQVVPPPPAPRTATVVVPTAPPHVEAPLGSRPPPPPAAPATAAPVPVVPAKVQVATPVPVPVRHVSPADIHMPPPPPQEPVHHEQQQQPASTPKQTVQASLRAMGAANPAQMLQPDHVKYPQQPAQQQQPPLQQQQQQAHPQMPPLQLHMANLGVGLGSLPSPTAPLSVAAAALDLGGLSLQPFGNPLQPTGSLLGALHNTAATAGAGLAGANGGVSPGFGMSGITVPPALSALWDKPVPSPPPSTHTSLGSGNGLNATVAGLVQPPAQQQQQQQQAPAQQQQQGYHHPGLGHAPLHPQMHQAQAAQHGYGAPGMGHAKLQHPGQPMYMGGPSPAQLGHLGGGPLGRGMLPGQAPNPAAPAYYPNQQLHTLGNPPQGDYGHGGPAMHGARMLAQATLSVSQAASGAWGASEPSGPCMMCGTAECNGVCWPCCHRCLCSTCAKRVMANHGGCPVCSKLVDNVFDV